MLLWIAIAIAIIYGFLKKFSDGLSDTSLWIAKIMMSEGDQNILESKGLLKANQAVLMEGWPSNILFITYLLPIASIIIGFIYSWWGGIIMMLSVALCGSVAEFFFRRPLTYYVLIYLSRMANRFADYKKNNDSVRADAIELFSDKIKEILTIYFGSGIGVPTSKKINENPYGDIYFLLSKNN
ncbi:MAG: hypothetical protein Q8891_07660 [Bacteroidota bacterium]|nr:hypothetical protein [Bacteroidota bacterium]